MHLLLLSAHQPQCINRIRLEFKAAFVWAVAARSAVLIESDWNLKHISANTNILICIVLIESDWNLKISVILELTVFAGINRIRLEFKVQIVVDLGGQVGY